MPLPNTNRQQYVDNCVKLRQSLMSCELWARNLLQYMAMVTVL